VVVLWLGCRCCCLSVSIQCGRIIIVFTDGRQQRQPNHNKNTYYVYWRTTTTINPIIIRPHCMLTDRQQQRQPNRVYCCFRSSVNTICDRIMIGLSLLSSVSKHTMWSYYDWVYCCCRPSVNTICGRIMIGLSLLSSVSKHTMWSYYDWNNSEKFISEKTKELFVNYLNMNYFNIIVSQISLYLYYIYIYILLHKKLGLMKIIEVIIAFIEYFVTE
jgi:hypothetical protein